MKKVIITLIMSLVLAGSAAVSALAQDDMASVKEQIADLEKKLSVMESKQAQSTGAATGLPGNMTFHGYFRGRVHIPQVENTTLSASEVAFQPSWDASDKIHGEVHLWFYPTNGFYLESAMATFDGVAIGKGGKLIAGKSRNLCYGSVPSGPNRLLSNYSLYSDAIHHDRVAGFQFLNKLDNGKIDLNVGILNGFTVGTRGVGIDLVTTPATSGSTLVLANREGANPSMDNNNNRAVSMRLSGKTSKDLELGLSVYAGRLPDSQLGSAATAADLNDLTGFVATKRKHTMYGGEFRYTDAPWIWQAEYTASDIGGFKFNAIQTVVGLDVTAKDSVYAQYGQINYSIAPAAALSATWDKKQIALSWKHKLAKAAWLQLEHEFNREDPPAGTPKIKNDVTILEYFIGY